MPGEPAARLEAHRPRGEVELVVHDHDVRRLGDPEARGQRADREPGLVHEGGRDGERHPAATERDDAGPRVGALLGPQRPAVALRQELHGVGPGVVQAPRVLRTGIPQPDDQQVRRGPPALRPGEGAAQGLALFGRGSAAASVVDSAVSPSAPSTASPSAASSSSTTTRGGWPDTTAVSGSTSVVTPDGSDRSETLSWAPMVSSEMSISSEVGMSWAGRGSAA